jgi:hypothetical protein
VIVPATLSSVESRVPPCIIAAFFFINAVVPCALAINALVVSGRAAESAALGVPSSEGGAITPDPLVSARGCVSIKGKPADGKCLRFHAVRNLEEKEKEVWPEKFLTQDGQAASDSPEKGLGMEVVGVITIDSATMKTLEEQMKFVDDHGGRISSQCNMAWPSILVQMAPKVWLRVSSERQRTRRENMFPCAPTSR